MLRKLVWTLTAVLLLTAGTWGGFVFIHKIQDEPTAASIMGPSSHGLETASVPGLHPAPSEPGPPIARGADEELETLPDELLIANVPGRFEDGVRSLGFTIIETVPLRQLGLTVYRLRTPSGTSVDDARRLLAARYPTATVDAHHLYRTQDADDYQDRLARPLAGWQPATPECGTGLRIGMIDSAVSVSHPALRGRRLQFRSFHKEGRRPGPSEHGTAIAAMLIGRPDWGGLLPGAELIAANMFEKNDAGRVIGSGMALLKSIDWLVEQRVQVVNLSIAGSDNRVVRLAFDRARRKGLLLVAAAGNWGSATRPAYPAAYPHVMAITAFDSDRSVYAKANRGSYIDFAAPGVRVYAAVPGGGRILSGTSFAVPYVSALVAMAVEHGMANTPDDLREFLSGSALDLGVPGKDDVYGWGFVQIQPKCQ